MTVEAIQAELAGLDGAGRRRILFTIDDQRVTILDVRHGKRLWPEPGAPDESE